MPLAFDACDVTRLSCQQHYECGCDHGLVQRAARTRRARTLGWPNRASPLTAPHASSLQNPYEFETRKVAARDPDKFSVVDAGPDNSMLSHCGCAPQAPVHVVLAERISV